MTTIPSQLSKTALSASAILACVILCACSTYPEVPLGVPNTGLGTPSPTSTWGGARTRAINAANPNCPCASCQHQRAMAQAQGYGYSPPYPVYEPRYRYGYAQNRSPMETISRELSNAQNIYQQVAGILDDFQ